MILEIFLYSVGAIFTVFSILGVSMFYTIWEDDALKWYNPAHWVFTIVGVLTFIVAGVFVFVGEIVKSRKMIMYGTGLDQAVNGLIGGDCDNTVSGAYGAHIRDGMAYWNELAFNAIITFFDFGSDNHGVDSIEEDELNPKRARS